MYVQRDNNGKIIGVFRQLQPGLAEEELPDDHFEVLAYLNPPKGYAERRREEYNRRGVTIEAIAEALIEHAGARPQKLQYLMTVRDEVRALIPKDAP